MTAARRHAGGTATTSFAEIANRARRRVDFEANMLDGYSVALDWDREN